MNDKKKIDPEELDRLFDEGEVDILEYFDTENVRHPNLEIAQISIAIPRNLLEKVEMAARHSGESRDDLITHWLSERAQGSVA